MSPRAASRAKRRAPRGRVVVAVVLVAFVCLAAAVIWRRTLGIARAREIAVLEQRRLQLVAERAQLESAVRRAASRGTIGEAAEEKLGMRVPSDTQVVILARPSAAPVRASAPASSASGAQTP